MLSFSPFSLLASFLRAKVERTGFIFFFDFRRRRRRRLSSHRFESPSFSLFLEKPRFLLNLRSLQREDQYLCIQVLDENLR